MEDFADRTINELIESYPIFVDALKEEYDVLMNIIDIVFSSCSIMSKTEIPGPHSNQITYEVFDCFFEYQIYKIMEKYRYYEKIKYQACHVKHIYDAKDRLDLKISNSSFDFYSKELVTMPFLHICYPLGSEMINIMLSRDIYIIEVEEKYHQDMPRLFNIHKRS